MAETVIWKFALEITDEQFVSMPSGARLLHVDVQHGEPQVWAHVQPSAQSRNRKLRVYGTGHPIESDRGAYVGTFQVHGGVLVFHLFDEGEA